MNPVRTEIKRDAKGRRIGDTTPADPIARLKQDETAVGGGDPPRRRNAGSAGSDDCHIEVGTALREHDRRRRDGCRGTHEEWTSAEPRHGVQSLAEADRMPEPAFSGKFYG